MTGMSYCPLWVTIMWVNDLHVPALLRMMEAKAMEGDRNHPLIYTEAERESTAIPWQKSVLLPPKDLAQTTLPEGPSLATKISSSLSSRIDTSREGYYRLDSNEYRNVTEMVEGSNTKTTGGSSLPIIGQCRGAKLDRG